MIAMPEKTPAYLPEVCPECGAKVWHRFSRIDPMSWTEADFLKEHEVNEETHVVRPRNCTCTADKICENCQPIDSIIINAVIEVSMKKLVDEFINGEFSGSVPVGVIQGPPGSTEKP